MSTGAMKNSDLSPREDVDDIQNELRRLRKINSALMGQVERSMDLNGNAFTLFRTAIVLENKVNDRTMELRRLNNELAKTKNAMSHFIAAASHDLLQPLNAARVFTAALSEQNLADENRNLVRQITHALDTTDELLSSLLDISRLDAGEMPMEISDFDVDEILRALDAELSPIAAAKGLLLKTRRCNRVLRSDKKMVRRIVQNFLTNAIRYTPEGRVLLGCRRVGDCLRIGVWDTGIGIPEDKRSEIFKEFQRLQTRSLQVDNGVGLGLAIVDRMATQLGVSVITRSKVGSGSYFAVDIPLAAHQAVELNPLDSLQEGPRQPLTGARILVIDNEPSIVSAMKSLLESWACSVEMSDGRQIDMRETPDVIVADYHLDDGQNGLQVVLDLRRSTGQAIPFVIITADYDPGLAKRVLGLGGHILNKPVKPARLRALLASLA